MRVPALRMITIAAFIVIWSCAVGSAQAQAQQDTCVRRGILVSAINERGDLLEGLAIENFQGEFRDEPVRILGVRRTKIVPRIVVILDASRSMSGDKRKWALARKIAGEVVQYGAATDQIGLIIFGSEVAAKVDLKEGRAAVIETLNLIPAEYRKSPKNLGRTALADAIVAGQQMLDPPQPGDVLYVITDGGDNWSRAKPRNIEDALFRGGTRLFLAFLIDWTPSSGGLGAGDRPQDMADLSGGIWFLWSGSLTQKTGFELTDAERTKLRTMLARSHRLMSDGYLVEIELPIAVEKPRKWELQLKSKPAGTKGVAKLLYPRKLMPCAPTPAAAQPK